MESLWQRHASRILCLAIGLTLLSVMLRTLPGLHRLLFVEHPRGATDLLLRYAELQRWFAGAPVYGGTIYAAYPPASYMLLFPFIGWVDETAARWIWCILSIVELALLSRWTIKLTRTTARLEKAVILLTFFSAYPITLTLGSGQLGIHILALILGALLLSRSGSGWLADLGTGALLVFAAAKPSFGAPLYFVFLFAVGRLRPVLIAVCGYGLLTALALSFQSSPPGQMLGDYYGKSAEVINAFGGAHIARWMHIMGWGEWTSLASIALFLALGLWIYRNRHADVWILLGVSAVIARVWTYHAPYDDQLIFLAMIPLLRWLRQDGMEERLKLPAACLLAFAWLAMFMPARTLYFPWPWNLPYQAGLPILWGLMLILLVRAARFEHISQMAENSRLSAKMPR